MKKIILVTFLISFLSSCSDNNKITVDLLNSNIGEISFKEILPPIKISDFNQDSKERWRENAMPKQKYFWDKLGHSYDWETYYQGGEICGLDYFYNTTSNNKSYFKISIYFNTTETNKDKVEFDGNITLDFSKNTTIIELESYLGKADEKNLNLERSGYDCSYLVYNSMVSDCKVIFWFDKNSKLFELDLIPKNVSF